jgi:hypothetical protein
MTQNLDITLVRTDLATTAWHASTVRSDLEIPGAARPGIAINLHMPAHGGDAAALEFARFLRAELIR